VGDGRRARKVGFDVRGKLLNWKRGGGTEKIQRTSTKGTANNEKKHQTLALEIGDGSRLSMDNYMA